jgi:hypothetical protein
METFGRANGLVGDQTITAQRARENGIIRILANAATGHGQSTDSLWNGLVGDQAITAQRGRAKVGIIRILANAATA